jgi:hypothetical protein
MRGLYVEECLEIRRWWAEMGKQASYYSFFHHQRQDMCRLYRLRAEVSNEHQHQDTKVAAVAEKLHKGLALPI